MSETIPLGQREVGPYTDRHCSESIANEGLEILFIVVESAEIASETFCLRCGRLVLVRQVVIANGY